MVGLGLTAPMASMMLMHSGIAQAQTAIPYKPTKRGGGGTLKLLWWQGPVLLNPQFATGTKEQEGSRIFYEPLAGWDADGNLVPGAGRRDSDARERRPGADGRSVTWKLKRGVTWHDGQPFTADDVVFNWEYHKDPATSTSWISTYRDIVVTKVDSHTVRVQLPEAHALLGRALRGHRGHDHPAPRVQGLHGRQVARGPRQHAPVGTGPYKIVDFKPGDLVLAGPTRTTTAQPAVLRPPGDEGRRRRHQRGARRAADRRVRLRLEPAGGRRDPEGPGGGGRGKVTSCPAATSSSSCSA
jgi:peptide/nickel transport system substrate-binding protein